MAKPNLIYAFVSYSGDGGYEGGFLFVYMPLKKTSLLKSQANELVNCHHLDS